MKLPGWPLLCLVGATFAHGAFERPAESVRLQALGNWLEEPEPLRQLLTPDDDYPPIKVPLAGDWLASHREKGQTFDQYRGSGANKPDETHRIIYLLPLGEFDEEGSPPLEEIRAYAAAFFQLEAKVLPSYQPDELEFDPRRNPHSGQRQILTSSVRAFLKAKLPPDAYCLLGITMADLYPAPSWNFVFGDATLHDRVGIYSFARYDPAFGDEPRGKDYRSLILQRSCKVLAHETAHMAGLNHCIYFDCVVNGSNGLSETDAQPQNLCPVCLRKLHFTIGFDAVKRYEELARFYRRQQWFDDYDWVRRQLARVLHEK